MMLKSVQISIGRCNIKATNVEIIKELVVLSEQKKTGWSKELNYVVWKNEAGHPYYKYDLREWSPDHSEYGKGITLSKEEFENLKSFFSSLSNNYQIDVPEGLLNC